jgi:hypothetical protein
MHRYTGCFWQILDNARIPDLHRFTQPAGPLSEKAVG